MLRGKYRLLFSYYLNKSAELFGGLSVFELQFCIFAHGLSIVFSFSSLIVSPLKQMMHKYVSAILNWGINKYMVSFLLMHLVNNTFFTHIIIYSSKEIFLVTEKSYRLKPHLTPFLSKRNVPRQD